MCGIVAATARRDVARILMTGLAALEYRGYDAAGIVCVAEGRAQLRRTTGRVAALEAQIDYASFTGTWGLAHTRWATHGPATLENTHPHVLDTLALVHNGLIDNHAALRAQLAGRGHVFAGQTDTEVLLHLIHELHAGGRPLLEALAQALRQVEGGYALALIDTADPEQRIHLARSGPPLMIGLGIGENFAASDVMALAGVTSRFIRLGEQELAVVSRERVELFDLKLQPLQRSADECVIAPEQVSLGGYSHYMHKEICEQDSAVEDTLLGRIGSDGLPAAQALAGLDEAELDALEHVALVACGSSHHAALVGCYHLGEYAGLSCSVELASEFAARRAVLPPHTLAVAISQSGETADTLAAMRHARSLGLRLLCICNVASSSMAHEADCTLLTRAGAEIGVASTKAFTTQLLMLLWLAVLLGLRRGRLSGEQGRELCAQLRTLPELIRTTLGLGPRVREFALQLAGQRSCLFLGRGTTYPIALEGALKLKEVTYIHAQGYAAGELKHGPIALIDEHLPVVIVAPDSQLGRITPAIAEVRARGARPYLITGPAGAQLQDDPGSCLVLPEMPPALEPVICSLPLQLLAYHAGVHLGRDVDRPRNLAKAVTVA